MMGSTKFPTLKFPALTIASLLTAAALWSCSKNNAPEPGLTRQQAQEQRSSPMPTASGGTMQDLRAGCPMIVQGADIAVSDAEGGVTLTFTTEAGDVADLRARVQHMAKMYEMYRGRRGMMWHHMGGRGRGPGAPGMGRMTGRGPMPAATAAVTEVERGARLELRPNDPSQLDALREHVRWHEQRMESGECWMLQEQNTPAQDGPD